MLMINIEYFANGFITLIITAFLINIIAYVFGNKVNEVEKIELYNFKKNTSNDFGNKKYYEYDEIPFFRDLPFNDDIFTAYYVSSQYGLCSVDQNIITIIFLKWIKDNNIKIVKNENCNSIIEVLLQKEPNDPNELKIFYMMKNASQDDILNTEEFKNYCNDNRERIKNEILNILAKKYGEIINNKKFINIYYNKENKLKPHYEFNATDEMNNKALQLAGLKKFFYEFSLISEKELVEVKIWKEYLIYAQIFGQADEVSNVLNKFYGINVSEFYDSDLLNNYLNDTIFSVFISDQELKEALGTFLGRIDVSDYSSGGGGFSSGGGGGGSFGGGGGGGGFR